MITARKSAFAAKFLCLAVASAVGSSAALAATIEEIIVTARATEKSVRDIPVAITAVNEDRMDDFGLAERIINKFRNRVPGDLTQIEDSINAGDAERTASLAHALKGTSANLSAEPLREVAARLESAGRAAELDAAPACLAQLRTEWNRFLEDVPSVLVTAKAGHEQQNQAT